MRLIDADALLEELRKEDEANHNANMVMITFDFETLIHDAPTIEPIGDLISMLIDAIEKCGEDKIYPQALIETIKALPSAEQTIQTPQTYGKSINPSNAEVVDDLISREDAIEVVCKELQFQEENRNEPYDNGTCFGLKTARELLLALPSADRPQVNSAEWVEQKEREFEELHRPKGEWVRYKRCDPVGDEIYAVMEAPDGKFFCNQCGKSAIKSNFCPHCGAYMKGVKDD